MIATKSELRWVPFFSLFEREVRRFLRVIIQTLFIPLVNSALYLLIFGVSLGENIKPVNGISYLAFLIPGLVMLGLLTNAFSNSSSSIATSRFHGNLEDLKIAPLAPTQIVFALALAGLVRGSCVGTIVFAVGEVFHRVTQGAWLAVAHPLILLVFMFLGGLSFAMFGMVVAFRARTFDRLEAVSGFLLTPLIYLGGVFFSLENLHPVWRILSRINPILYLINGVRYGILGAADIEWTTGLLFAFVTTAILFVASFRTIVNGFYGRW